MDRLDTHILIAAGMKRLGIIDQGLHGGWAAFVVQGFGHLEAVHEDGLASGSVRVRKEVEELQPCWVGEVRIVGMGADRFGCVCRVLEGHVCRKVPESTCIIQVSSILFIPCV